ncbi:response regulator [Asticcacaulis biprosthecium C19]|uniref:Response regulator n=1 Tax=Asticcacaulis biprosthecium C19 TaxID=715226 RepID=F4QQI8_9CAUL|nr:response regulator [Asticcacaulis biprosthecium]EGF90475.1 response regulator [Asticcacaulis biprosthecium C19]
MPDHALQPENPSNTRILIVEDEALLAYALEELLIHDGFTIAGVAGRLEAALDIIATGNCDAAILDANLAGTSSAPAATALTALGVPFIVVSGYSAAQLQEVSFEGAIHLQKPCDINALTAALRELLKTR